MKYQLLKVSLIIVETYQPLKEKRCSFAETNSCVFALEPLLKSRKKIRWL